MDKRVIKNVKPFSTTAVINPVEYEMINTNKKCIGVISQDLESIDSRLVKKNSNGLLTVDYEQLTALLLAKINTLEERMKSLESGVDLALSDEPNVELSIKPKRKSKKKIQTVFVK